MTYHDHFDSDLVDLYTELIEGLKLVRRLAIRAWLGVKSKRAAVLFQGLGDGPSSMPIIYRFC